ncbi:MAG TPA: LuxR C-terminal-related transcriptional regulator [Candidatus Dormibacteraeota bacterium]|nr:LuxR C-terminal-related transcriptional regulator [Candidatus Dormibacteraeota bacterium]
MPSRQGERETAARASRFVPTVQRNRAVRTKLSAPVRRPGIVDRPELVEGLLSTMAYTPVVLVSAPAGYGKTTLLALWQERDERPFAWVTLDPSDNDPVSLVACVIAALDPVVEIDEAARDALGARQAPLDEVVLPAIADACAASREPFVLVLDDLHRVTETRSQTAIGYLGERLPAGCQLALATRTDPPLPLASWRAHGRLVELRAAEMSLGDAEARALLSAAGVTLSPSGVARLVGRTEGWAAALYLAALSLRNHPQPEDFVARFAGTSRHVGDFLSEDVLGREADGVIEFLLHTCVVEELSASLCDALTGGTTADAMLRELERSNLFVVPLDEERCAFRYHHLFSEYLRAELARREPGLVPELHRRAWRWYRERGQVDRAVAHAQAAGDVDVAAGLVAGVWSAVSQSGQIETVRHWLAGFEDAQIEGHTPLAVAAAWVSALTGEPERAAHFAEAARRGSWEGPMPDGTASLESALAIMSSAFGHDGISRMHSGAQRAVDLEHGSSQHRAIALELLGVALKLEGDLAGARDVLREAVRLAGDTSTGAMSLTYLALVSLREGDEDTALCHAQRAHAIAELPRMRANLASVLTYSVMAHLLARRHEIDGAAAAVERANALLPLLTEGFWWMMIETRILLAPALHALGRGEEAVARLDEAEALLAEHPDAGRLPEWHADAVRELHAADRRPARSQALSDAERRILHLLATELTLRDIGRELYLSLNTVKTHTHSIYRKLGVSSRAEAVQAGERGSSATGGDSPG